MAFLVQLIIYSQFYCVTERKKIYYKIIYIFFNKNYPLLRGTKVPKYIYSFESLFCFGFFFNTKLLLTLSIGWRYEVNIESGHKASSVS